MRKIVYDVLVCNSCGMKKYVVSTGLPSMMTRVESTAHCCKNPDYSYDPYKSFQEFFNSLE